MNLPLISIIIPLYNVEKVLSRCVDSVLAQTFKKWELILVDDGSLDNSGVLCEKYKSQDVRINVIHQSNGGVSSARNTGLKQAQGEYVTFVDADDYLRLDYLENLFVQTPADFVICGFENGENTFIPPSNNINLTRDASAVKMLVEVPYYLDTPWSKLFKRSIIIKNNLSFNQRLRLSEDTLFCYEYLRFCKKVVVESSSSYIYEGLWGGDIKYELTYDELNYTSQKVVRAIEYINHTFGTNISTRHKCVHLSKLKGLFSDFTDVDIYNLYIKSHPKITFDDFMADNRISPLPIGILKTIRYVKEKKNIEARQHLIYINRFITQPIKKYPTRKQCLFYSLLKIFGTNFILWALKHISNQHGICKE